jgi:hypothetical protein
MLNVIILAVVLFSIMSAKYHSSVCHYADSLGAMEGKLRGCFFSLKRFFKTKLDKYQTKIILERTPGANPIKLFAAIIYEF